MKFSPVKIFGFGLTANSCFDECLETMRQDNELLGYSVANNKTFDGVVESILSHFDSDPASSSLAAFGLFDYAIRHQLRIANRHLMLLVKARLHDPLKVYDERKVVLAFFENQLSSYILNQGLQVNEYCN